MPTVNQTKQVTKFELIVVQTSPLCSEDLVYGVAVTNNDALKVVWS